MPDFAANESITINEADSRNLIMRSENLFAESPIGRYSVSPNSLDRNQIPMGILGTLQLSEYHKYKRFWEFPLALLLFIPVIALTAFLILLIRMTSQGPGIYSQLRTGRGGKNFKMHKLRSMYLDAEDFGPQWCAGDLDPRTTPLGRWLRKLHLDELPQIINVLKNEMSFCGPRPERPEFVEKLDHFVPYYRSRLLVRPGITGFSQINLPPDTCLKSVLRKQTLDLEYVETGRFVSDLRMIMCTALRLVGISGAKATQLAGLEMNPENSRFSLIYAPLWEEEEPKTNDTNSVSRRFEVVPSTR